MSNTLSSTEQDCDSRLSPCSAVELIIQPRDRDLGGFPVRRLLPMAERRMVGPWIFFDHMGPAQLPAGRSLDVRPHPHIGLATVTYLFEGEILHRDSLGSLQLIRPGDINLMVAGRGIVHSERQRAQVIEQPHRLEGLQLWLALPEADEECEPAFHHYPGDTIPATTVDGVQVRVLMGRAYGLTSPVRIFSDAVYAEARLRPGQRLTLPDVEERAVYVASGAIITQGTEMPAHSMTVFRAVPGVVVEARQASLVALIGGTSPGKRFIDWNFVSSRRERIEQAAQEWRDGRFELVPGDETEFIPYPG